jgi:hypothetical protein
MDVYPLMRPRILLVALVIPLFGAGCLGLPESDAVTRGGPLLGLDGELDPETGRLVLSLDNGTDQTVTVGCEDAYCGEAPMLRLEAQQADGAWVTRPAFLGYEADRDALREIVPGQRTVVGELLLESPGIYRAVLRVDAAEGAHETRRELLVTGWSRDLSARALSHVDRADAADCGYLGLNMWDALLMNAEHDDVLSMLSTLRRADDDASVGRRWRTLFTMLERGAFVAELSDEVRTMSDEDLDRFAYELTRLLEGEQAPLRAVVAELLFDRLGRADVLEEVFWELLSRFEGVWPVHATDTLMVRLSEGPEESDDLAALVDVIAYAEHDGFDSEALAILSMLATRCEDAPGGSKLASSCERARIRFTPGSFGGFGRAFGTSSRCGGFGFIEIGRCREISEAWGELRDAAGAPVLHVLGGDVVPLSD